MIAKTAQCAACPACNNSQHWVPDVYVAGSQVLVLQGEVSEYDVKGQRVASRNGYGKYSTVPAEPCPLIGPDGYDLSRSFYQLAGLEDDDVSIGSVVRCLTGLVPTGKEYRAAAAYCQATHFHPPASIELVIALGPVAAQAMGLEGKIEQWRGHVIEGNSGGSRSA